MWNVTVEPAWCWCTTVTTKNITIESLKNTDDFNCMMPWSVLKAISFLKNRAYIQLCSTISLCCVVNWEKNGYWHIVNVHSLALLNPPCPPLTHSTFFLSPFYCCNALICWLIASTKWAVCPSLAIMNTTNGDKYFRPCLHNYFELLASIMAVISPEDKLYGARVRDSKAQPPLQKGHRLAVPGAAWAMIGPKAEARRSSFVCRYCERRLTIAEVGRCLTGKTQNHLCEWCW